MRISTKGRYGLKAMNVLARAYGEGPMALREIANQTGVPAPYLEQLFKKLRKAGLIHSERGATGGYRLSREPKDITAGAVIRALEGSIAPVECADEGIGECEIAAMCVENLLYTRIRQSVDAVVDAHTLADLLTEQQKLNQAEMQA